MKATRVEFVGVGDLVKELVRAQRRWERVERTGQAAGTEAGEVFELARAVVCEWWERKEFWEREAEWGPRLEQVVAATRWWRGHPAAWGVEQWRLLARDVVAFPEVVAVAEALVDPRMQKLTAGNGPGALVRAGGGGARLAGALGRRLGREWLVELDGQSRRAIGVLGSRGGP
ncbi:hypothetical protein ACIO02_37045 [Streptomyces sp. NPDC087568]|uniref:hypothetical protein n=1 Tax=Streptomyces sp. NPDC087568 TaxID=3365799 RepID=UPI003800B94C